jgi:hypothetical protein
MDEIIFLVEEASQGGFTARTLGYSIFTKANTWDELKAAVKDAIDCHFEPNKSPAVKLQIAQK